MPGGLHVHTWEETPPRELGEDRLAERPLAVCMSGGGFRAYACALGELRALHDLGVLDEVGLLVGVSGGAWAIMAHTFAPAAEGHVRARLGEPLPPGELTLEALERALGDDHLAKPVTQLDALALARTLREEIPTSRIFGRVLGAQLLEPLGIAGSTSLLTGGPRHTADFLARNPEVSRDDVLEVPEGRPPALAGASLLRQTEEGLRYQPIELSPVAVTRTLGPEWPCAAAELAALADEGFGLADLLAATGGAPGGVLVRIARSLGLDANQLVLAAAGFLAEQGPAYLVDGGYVDNLGILPALRRGATRLAVFANSNTGLAGNASPWHVSGVEAQISRLFGKVPLLGGYGPLPLFEEEELADLGRALMEARERGEAPWALVRHHLREDNPLGLPPREILVYWHVNEIGSTWRGELPAETQRALASPLGPLYGVPHLPVAFAQGGYLFRLRGPQLASMIELHDRALRERPADVWESLTRG